MSVEMDLVQLAVTAAVLEGELVLQPKLVAAAGAVRSILRALEQPLV
jgi:hypothetical protein